MLLPLNHQIDTNDPPLLGGTLSIKRPGPLYFVRADWREIKDDFERINAAAEHPNAVIVTNGRFNHLWNNMFHHQRNDYVTECWPADLPGTIIELHPGWARDRGIQNGQVVRLAAPERIKQNLEPGNVSDREKEFRRAVYGIASLQGSIVEEMQKTSNK